MLNIDQILKSTFAVAKKNSADVHLVEIRKGYNKNGDPKVLATAFTRVKSDGKRKTGAPPRHKCSCTMLDHKKPFTGPVKVSCECLSGHTLVHTSKGYKSMYELAEPQNSGATVTYIVDGEKYIGSAPFYKGKQPVWTLSFNTGLEVTGTKDHLFQCYTEKGRTWVPLKDITPGMKICRSVDSIKVNLDKTAFDHGFFLGTMMGDGTGDYLAAGNAEIQLYGAKQEFMEFYRGLDLIRKSTDTRLREGSRIGFTHRAKELLLRYDFISKKSVNLPSKSHILGYVSGLLATDGSITRQAKIDGDFGYISQLQRYLLDLGLTSPVLAKIAVKGTSTNYGVRNKDLWRLSLPVSALLQLAPYLRLRKKHLDQIEKILERPKQSRVPLATVVDKKYAGRQAVYDINVPEISRFSANGVIVHNCDYFTYNCEYALFKKGAADIRYSNGEPPTTLNVGLQPSVCKHLYALLTDLKHQRP